MSLQKEHTEQATGLLHKYLAKDILKNIEYVYNPVSLSTKFNELRNYDFFFQKAKTKQKVIIIFEASNED